MVEHHCLHLTAEAGQCLAVTTGDVTDNPLGFQVPRFAQNPDSTEAE